MKKNHLIKGLTVLAIALTFGACKKDGGSSAQTQLSFGLGVSNTASLFAASANTGGLTTNAVAVNAVAPSITWTAGIANISYFKFEAKKGTTEIEIKSRNLTNIDLFALTPAVIGATIDTGTYREIEVKAFFAKSSSGAIPLVLKGNYTSSAGVVTPVEFDFNEDAIIKLEAENVKIDGTTDIDAIAKLSLNKLLNATAASLLDAATRTGGTIIISSTSNTNIYDKVKANVALCGSWGGFSRHGKR